MLTATDAEFLHQFSHQWLEAWNSHATERVIDLLHPEIVWDDRTFWTRVIRPLC